MELYGGIDLHSNNNVVALIDTTDKLVYQKRLPNDLGVILEQMEPYRDQIEALVVESTYNWYWLVDGLMKAGYQVHLANTAAIQQYEGLKYVDDRHDARWLAHLLRLGILPEGFIYPRQERPVRDLLRKRSQLVRHKTAHILSIQNLMSRNTGVSFSGNRAKKLTAEDVEPLLPEEDLALALESNVVVMQCLQQQIHRIERRVASRVRLKPQFQQLKSVNGIGQILALTIMLETGDIRRFRQVGHFASYCRCVSSLRRSNGKLKGHGNAKNGNKYLAWAFVEAAHFAVRYNDRIRRYYQRKKAKTNSIVAIKTVAHKLARACFYVLRDQVPFQAAKAFA